MNRNTLIIIGANAVFILGALAIAFFGTGGFNGQVEPERNLMPTGDFILALSWEPAFCETRPNVPECARQTEASVDASQFSLHGLWPDGASYCGVSEDTKVADERGDWESLPVPDLSADLRARVETVMPGALSRLDRHEWIKHGTCANVDAETYYATSVALVDAINASPLPKLFLDNLGNFLSAAEIASVMDEVFGAGTGERTSLECVTDGSRRLISGIRIALSGEIGTEPDIGALAAGARGGANGCKGGVVDPAGLQ